MRRFRWCVLAGSLWMISAGCSLMHDLRPHRLWRWNRGPAPSGNPFFSVSDPILRLGQAAEPLESLNESANPTDERLTAM